MNIKLISILTLTLITAGCGDGVQVGPIEIPPSQEGIKSEIYEQKTPIQNVFIEYQNGFEVGKSQLDFEPRGIIPGTISPMIPLGKSSSELEALGFVTHISIDGEQAVLEYGSNYLEFKTGQKTVFINDKDSLQIADEPYYANGTIYIPLLAILDGLKIDYEVVGSDLTIGGMYTDDTGKPYSGTTESSSELRDN